VHAEKKKGRRYSPKITGEHDLLAVKPSSKDQGARSRDTYAPFIHAVGMKKKKAIWGEKKKGTWRERTRKRIGRSGNEAHPHEDHYLLQDGAF